MKQSSKQPKEQFLFQGPTAPSLLPELWKYIIQMTIRSSKDTLHEIIIFQSLSEVSKDFYKLIGELLAKESFKKGPKFISILFEVERDKIGLVGILLRLKEIGDNHEYPLLIVDYVARHFRCPLCSKSQKIGGDVNDRRPRKFTCPDCNTKYRTTIEWQDNGTNDRTERCACKRLTTKYNDGSCLQCNAKCCLECCGRSVIGLLICRQCMKAKLAEQSAQTAQALALLKEKATTD